jgi:hypothetical protein
VIKVQGATFGHADRRVLLKDEAGDEIAVRPDEIDGLIESLKKWREFDLARG